MALNFLDRRPFWKGVQHLFTIAAAACSSAAVLELQHWFRPTVAGAGFLFAVGIALASWRHDRIGEREALAVAEETRRIRARAEGQAKELCAAVLENFRNKYFGREMDQEAHKHRATLFRCVESDREEGRTKHLEIFARSGVYPNSNCRWPVDDNDIDRCRGIAARIWFTGASQTVTASCGWPDDGDAAMQANYATSLGITVAEAAALNVKSLGFTGTRIVVRGERWGVLLLDSLKAECINESERKRKILKDVTALLTEILSRVEP